MGSSYLSARSDSARPAGPVILPDGLAWPWSLLASSCSSRRPSSLPAFANPTIVRVGVFAAAVLGLNVIMGYTGQVKLGQIFFVGLGAYVTAYGVNQRLEHPRWCSCGLRDPRRRRAARRTRRRPARRIAIAMVTIALPIVGVPLAKRLSDFTGGSEGISTCFSNAPAGTGLLDDQWQFYIVLLVGGRRSCSRASGARQIRPRLRHRQGQRGVATSMGISPYRSKVLAFTIASIFGGASGFLYMAAVQYTSPETLSFGHSISLLAAMVIGGRRSIVGSLLGGAYYVFVPQLTNPIDPTSRPAAGRDPARRAVPPPRGPGVAAPRADPGRLARAATRGPAAPPSTPWPTTESGTAPEGPETERQDNEGHARTRRVPRRRSRRLWRSLAGCCGRGGNGDQLVRRRRVRPGITDTSITLGITTPLSGATAGPGTCTVAGIRPTSAPRTPPAG